MVKFNVVRISYRYLCPGVVWICVIWLNVCICFRSQEGSQYVRGFGGIGGMLRYTVDFQVLLIYNLLELFCDLRKSDICVKNLYLDRLKKKYFLCFVVVTAEWSGRRRVWSGRLLKRRIRSRMTKWTDGCHSGVLIRTKCCWRLDFQILVCLFEQSKYRKFDKNRFNLKGWVV